MLRSLAAILIFTGAFWIAGCNKQSPPPKPETPPPATIVTAPREKTPATDPTLDTLRKENSLLQNQNAALKSRLDEATKTIFAWQQWAQNRERAAGSKRTEVASSAFPLTIKPPPGDAPPGNAPPGYIPQPSRPYVLDGTVKTVKGKEFKLVIARDGGKETEVQVTSNTRVVFDGKLSSLQAIRERQIVRCHIDLDSNELFHINIYEVTDRPLWRERRDGYDAPRGAPALRRP